MLQSVSAARCLLQALALLLALGALSSQSWAVIDLPASVHTSPSNISSNSNSTSTTQPLRSVTDRITFAPGRYCLHSSSPQSTRECHEYAFLLNHLGESSRSRVRSDGQVAIHAAALNHKPASGNSDRERETSNAHIDRVLTSWCVLQPSGSWFVQGAESMVCLVVLDTCLYTMVFWALFGALATGLSLASHWWPRQVQSPSAFCSYTTALLGCLLVVEWWGYSAYFIDRAYLQSLALAWRYGAAFTWLCGSVLLSLVAARITLHQSIRSQANYAQLHAAAPSAPASDSPAASVAAVVLEQECRDENADPLRCPANYHV